MCSESNDILDLDVEVVPSTVSDAYLIKNLYPLYAHDMSAFTSLDPNPHGVFETPEIRSLGEQGELLNAWWERPEALHPYLIRVGPAATPVGFAMVAEPPFIPSGGDYYMHEFFVVQSVRGTGVAQHAAIRVFERFAGRWEIQALRNNRRARSFWLRVVTDYTKGDFNQSYVPTWRGADSESLSIRFVARPAAQRGPSR